MKLKLFFYRYLALLSACITLGVSSVAAYADAVQPAWGLVADQSKVSYVSIKKGVVGESNHFTSITGGISEAGEVSISIDLSSVETHIDIRNDRLVEHVFGGKTAKATLTAAIDLKAFDRLVVGEMTTIEVNGGLHFLGKTTDITAQFFIARLNENRVLVVTDEMIIVKTGALGVNKGIDTLMELASLPSIARVVPVSLRMVFDKK
jgi:polyisoprenoid-binding protein YceI